MKRKERRKYGGRVAPHNIFIGNRRTSIRLEAVMWDALDDIARDEGKTVDDVILEVDRGRQDELNLSAALRVYIVQFYREALRRCRKEKAPPKRGSCARTI